MQQFLRYTALLSVFLLLLPTAPALAAARIAQLPLVVEGVQGMSMRRRWMRSRRWSRAISTCR
ncbi:hypothetical protein [Selenomonas sp. oral taxon 149]|uniref:hypothetical protein n=1 Tax=Selenomonas sp. oral taxon 149 TaxID=712535 RepID=UPI0011127BF3|nr:hypothetical protein [Selenomonas sp. oral taxon 149]